MVKTTLTITGLFSLAIGLALGFTIAARLNEPPAPRTPADFARDVALRGELRALLMEPDPFVRVEKLAARLATLGPDAVAEVRDVVRHGATGTNGAETDLLIRFWTRYEPVAASDWAWRGAEDGVREIAVDSSMETWATFDPTAAANHIGSYANSTQMLGDIGRQGLVRGWYASGQPGVEDYIRSIGHGIPQMRCMKTLAREVVRREGFDATIGWLDDLEDRGHLFKKSMYRRAAPVLRFADHDRTLAWCEEVCDGPFGDHLRAVIARDWALVDGLAAMTWVSTAEPGYQQDRAVRDTFSHWQTSDPEGLGAWLAEMGPDGVEPWFQAGAYFVASIRAYELPLEAYEWAAHIKSPEQRERMQIQISRHYLVMDEVAAEAWMEQASLSEKARAEARQRPPGFIKMREQMIAQRKAADRPPDVEESSDL
jgi:hypothetical protein